MIFRLVVVNIEMVRYNVYVYFIVFIINLKLIQKNILILQLKFNERMG